MEKVEMSIKGVLSMRTRVTVTLLLTVGWLAAALGWIVSAWEQYGFFQYLTGLGIAALLWAASMGVLWVVEKGFVLVATVLTTFGSLSFLLYWVAFAWTEHSLLQNGAVLLLTPFAWLVATAVLWLAGPLEEYC
jgi:hypothetical protein